MREKQIVLSARLQMLADMVTVGNRAIDVGCDHGFLSIYLIQHKVSPHVLAMDVRKGPLDAAKEHVRECELETYIETRLSDGLIACNAEEGDTVICAGMGGRLMQKILMDSFDKVKQMKELILQPQSELGEFRSFLRTNGFLTVDERAVFEDGKYYFAMRVVYDGTRDSGLESVEKNSIEERLFQDELSDEFGAILLKRRDAVLKDYLMFRKNVVSTIDEGLREEKSERALERLKEVRSELTKIEKAISFYETEEK